jgi:hypothetical protein
MNLKCNPILNINIVNFLIIHVVINFNYGNCINVCGWFLRKKRLIMDFWTMALGLSQKESWKMWTKKKCHSSVKILNKIGHHQLENLRLKFTFSIQFYFKNFIIFYHSFSISHWSLQAFMNFLTNHMFRDKCKVSYQYLWPNT